MVYTIYETNCIIFNIKNLQENDVLIKAFSDKFGIISIIATGFRKESSKLKANTKEYSINRLALVRGKEFFRLTDSNHIFAFSSSKTLVEFLRRAESLFFGDELEYFDDINTQIYEMVIHLCRFITFVVKSERADKKEMINLANIFFTIYVRGLQGFISKIDTSEVLKNSANSLVLWFETQSSDLKASA
ncbi:recombination protein O N-terminal domain-containing protein, partial [Candidatus Parcubacteria bacterium]|nr:recombination protein O N-terminal domain-containing protein [Candidatus Parcubacteria bacterium]